MKQGLTIMKRCRQCAGTGQVVNPHCQVCGHQLAADDAWWEGDSEALPCGHDEAELVEQTVCSKCDGNGRYPQTLTPEQTQAYLRHQKARRAFVATLVLLLVLSLAVVVWREPQYMCGGWLMSAVSLLLFSMFG